MILHRSFAEIAGLDCSVLGVTEKRIKWYPSCTVSLSYTGSTVFSKWETSYQQVFVECMSCAEGIRKIK